MRKTILCLMMLLLLAVAMPALAETYVLDEIYGSIEIPDSYIVLMENNLNSYADWLESRGTTAEETASDFARRGVLLQAWTAEYDACFELRAIQNERSHMIFDVNEQSSEVRGAYRTSHYPKNEYEGYGFTTSEWNNTPNGRFLVLRYTRRDNGEILYRGFMRRTIRNGYEIDFDMQIYDRATTNRDNTNLNTIWDSFNFIEVLPLPPAASAKINITDAPPEETNDQSFEIEGTASEGVTFTAVVMGLSYPEPLVSSVTVGRNGRLSMPITLPREGVFLITMTAEYQGEDVLEVAYPVTYQRTLLTINMTTRPDAVVMEDEVVFSGTSEPGASIQVFLNGADVMTRRVNTAGKFSVTLDVDEEGEYEAILVFSRKGLADRRITIHFTRRWTQEDMQRYLRNQAIAPSYRQLTNNMQNYEGRIMGYRAYIIDISQSGADYVVRMALTRSNGEYSNYILVTTVEQPAFAPGERVMMYGTCAGLSLGTGTEGEEETNTENYPCFELLLFSSLS